MERKGNTLFPEIIYQRYTRFPVSQYARVLKIRFNAITLVYIPAHRWTGFQTSLSNQWIRRQINVDWLNQKRLSISCGSVIGLQCYIDMEAFFLCRPPPRYGNTYAVLFLESVALVASGQ